MPKFLTTLRLIDFDGNVSLTNIAVIVSIVKLATAPTPDFAAVGALLASLASYQTKRALTT